MTFLLEFKIVHDTILNLADADSMLENLCLLTIFLILPFFDFISLLSLRIELNTMAKKSSIRTNKPLVFFFPPILNYITNKVNKKVSTFAPKKTKNINKIIVLNPSES